ncbi:hypothetical protein [Bifidobacterium aquikefiricola]|uniref:Uncharacterized protein n=1 Tax=Bifidobacterium aquikefiricola TaxID=3059038 RepID=A0AB39U6B8_9BIFI
MGCANLIVHGESSVIVIAIQTDNDSIIYGIYSNYIHKNILLSDIQRLQRILLRAFVFQDMARFCGNASLRWDFELHGKRICKQPVPRKGTGCMHRREDFAISARRWRYCLVVA